MADAPRRARPGNDLDWIPTVTDAYDLLNNQRLDNAVEVAFVEADFEEASRVGWTAISRIKNWPDLLHPLGLSAAFHESWLWRTALASVVAPPDPDEVLRLPLDHFVHDVERTLSKPTGRGPFSAGFFDLDALARLAAHRLDTQGVERLGKEAYKARALGVTEFRDIRVLASSPFLRNAALGRDAKLQFPIVPGATPLLDRTFEDAGARQFRFLQTYKEGKNSREVPDRRIAAGNHLEK